MAQSKSKTATPGSVAEAVAHLAVWAKHAPRGFAHVEYHSEYARAEADRQLGETLVREDAPYHRIELPVRVNPSQAGRFLIENLEKIESGTVSVTGFGTAVIEDDYRDFLAILSVRREVLAEFGLCQTWWLTPAFREALMHIAPDLDSWFMIRVRLEEDCFPAGGEPPAAELIRPAGPASRIDEALRRAASLVERFQSAIEAGTRTTDLVALAASAADAIAEVEAPGLTGELADRVVGGLTAACGQPLADCLPTLQGLNRLARLLVTQGRSKEAAPLVDRALAMLEQRGRPDDSAVVGNILVLGGLHAAINRPDQAEALYRRATDVAERLHGPWNPDVAIGLSGLARLLWLTSRLKEAEALSRRALAIDERDLGRHHPDVAADLANLATVLQTAGRLTEAEPLRRRALAIDERWLGPDDPSVATALHNLSVLLRAMDRRDEAEAVQRRALEIDERILGPDHPTVASDLVNLASVLQAAGRPAEAEPLVRRALAIDETAYGPDHPRVVRDRDLLASLLG